MALKKTVVTSKITISKVLKQRLEAGMKELGITNPADIKINLSYNTSEAHAAIAQYVQEGWTKT